MRSCSRTALLVIAVGCGWGCAAGTVAQPPGPPDTVQLRVVREIPLELPSPSDVRWMDRDMLAIVDAVKGVFVLDPAAESPRPEPLGAAAGRAADFPTVHLGASDSHLAVGQSAFLLRWQEREPGATAHTIATEYLADLDVRGDQLLTVGVRRHEVSGELAPDAAIAWRSTLVLGAELEPILRSAAGPGAITMQDCALVDISQARFLAGGGFLIVPGVDRGVYLYDEKSRLVRVWSTSALGIDTGCPPLREQEPGLGGDPAARTRFLSSRRIVDEIVDLPGGPALLVRSVATGIPSWELIRLDMESEQVRVEPFPLKGRSAGDRLKADVAGTRLAVLVAGELGGGSDQARVFLLEIDH